MRKVYVDTNVIIDYCLVRDTHFKPNYLFVYEFFRRCVECEFYVVISSWCLEESYKIVDDQKVKILLDWISSKVISIQYTKKQLQEAKSQDNWPDALHAIIARDADCEIIATNDLHFGAFSKMIGSARPESI